jgi:hypothetical protein
VVDAAPSTSANVDVFDRAEGGLGGFRGGRGGNAVSITRVDLVGSGAIDAQSEAVGGRGGAGGHASSSAVGVADSAQFVSVQARAVGADSYEAGGSSTDPAALGGTGSALSSAQGLGRVGSTALAMGGRGGMASLDGAADARATATSARFASSRVDASGGGANTAFASSIVSPVAGPISQLTVSLDGAGADGRTLRATTIARDGLPVLGPFDPGSRAVGSVYPFATGPEPTLADLDITLETAPESNGPDASSMQRVVVEMMLAIPAATGRTAALKLTQATVQGGGFDQLSISIALDDVSLVDRIFTDPAEAIAFFSTKVVGLGALDTGLTGRLVYDLAVTSTRTGDAFSTGAVLQIVPEPTTGTLLLVGLAWVAAGRRARR